MPDPATGTISRIVVGVDGSRGSRIELGTFAAIMLGSVSQHCVQRAPWIVFVVPPAAVTH